MENKKRAFDEFAPAILKIYRRDKEAFWEAAMAPFMSDSSIFDMWRHRKIGLDLFSAYQGLNDQAQHILREFCQPLSIDVTRWKSNRNSYFRDAYPIFAFLAIWMDEMGLSDFLDAFNDVLRAAVFGVAGYGVLDENVDSNAPSPVEILTSQALIAEYEVLVLQVFGVSKINLEILHKMRSLFLAAEIKEKSMRGIASPYRLENPEECGAKGAHVVTPFILSLDRLGKAAQIEDYWQVFLLFGAVIQVIDDWTDLEKDLAVGHFSYVTLGTLNINDARDPKKTAKMLREDQERVRSTYERCKEMINHSRTILTRLEDPFLVRLVDVTDLRLEAYFKKDLKLG